MCDVVDMIVGLRHGLAAVDDHGMPDDEGGRLRKQPDHGRGAWSRIESLLARRGLFPRGERPALGTRSLALQTSVTRARRQSQGPVYLCVPLGFVVVAVTLLGCEDRKGL